MPRYHFHVHDGTDHMDDVGQILGDLNDARRASLNYAGDLIHDAPVALWSGEDWRMEVTDEKGLVLFLLLFSALNAPSTMKL